MKYSTCRPHRRRHVIFSVVQGGRSDRNGAETEPWFAVVKTRSGRSACACVRQPIIGA
ncbi:hypothetical protein DP49_3034 [Burkholderia pseudomallei]|nr:hypothetical protein DP49_3034 [Burkholderia pseudomallei]